jgi:hypothetical protein
LDRVINNIKVGDAIDSFDLGVEGKVILTGSTRKCIGSSSTRKCIGSSSTTEIIKLLIAMKAIIACAAN